MDISLTTYVTFQAIMFHIFFCIRDWWAIHLSGQEMPVIEFSSQQRINTGGSWT